MYSCWPAACCDEARDEVKMHGVPTAIHDEAQVRGLHRRRLRPRASLDIPKATEYHSNPIPNTKKYT
eukprot:5986136-Pleurochrysis_carterae.AAC.1